LGSANIIKAKKIVELQNEAHGFSNTGLKQRANFIKYLQANNTNSHFILHLVRYREYDNLPDTSVIIDSLLS
jgi:hypothetical protein